MKLLALLALAALLSGCWIGPRGVESIFNPRYKPTTATTNHVHHAP